MEEYGKQCKSEAIEETVKACAESAMAYLDANDQPQVSKGSILEVSEQLKAKL